MKNMVQISMDGPNVNHKLYDIITEERKENGHPELINVGSCSLHGVHGAFHTDEKKKRGREGIVILPSDEVVRLATGIVHVINSQTALQMVMYQASL